MECIKKCEKFFNTIYKLRCKTVPFKNSQLLLCQGSTPNKDSLNFPKKYWLSSINDFSFHDFTFS